MLNLGALALAAPCRAGHRQDLLCPERRARNKREQPDSVGAAIPQLAPERCWMI